MARSADLPTSSPRPGAVGEPEKTPGAAAEGPGELPDLRVALRGAWTNLPVLLLGSVAVSLAALATVVATRGGLLLAVVVGLLTVAPTLMALIATSLEIAGGQEPTLAQHLRQLRRLALRAIGICAVPAALALLTQIALVAYAQGGGALMLVPAALGATTTVLTALAALVALPLRAGADTPTGLRGWLLAMHLFARSPVPFLASAVVAATGIWLASTISNGLFLLVPAPFALVLAVALRTATH